MRNLGGTVARLKSRLSVPDSGAGRLAPVKISGPNPGALGAWEYVPDSLPAAPALVVVLHGCTQTAGAYDLGSGWSTMADQYGFIVLFPEQKQANNPGLCFNWYAPEDARRGGGEAASIRAAIETTILQHAVDRSCVFVTGLSAGGAMTSVMLAAYPEVFAGGAVIAGLPYGCASSVPEAFDRMRGHGLSSAAASTAAVLTASGHAGPWPSVSIWHGSADHTVTASNADALVAQWAGVHDLGLAPHETHQVAGHAHRLWRDAAGQTVLEDYRLAGMGHGAPIDTRGAEACGKAGPYMLDVGLSSTRVLVRRWGLDTRLAARPSPAALPSAKPLTTRSTADETPPARADDPPPRSHVQQIIEDALKCAGLMR